MRKLLLTTAAVAAAIAGAFAAEPSLGTFTDTRDGQTYKTVTIGTQTWMAQNLNYQTDSSWCYENKAASCKKYGRLYDWKTAKTVCPNGWMLPFREDWNRLMATAGGDKKAGMMLKARSGWERKGNGNDDFGFSALPGGRRNTDGCFFNAGNYGYWWTANEDRSDRIDNNDAYYRYMNHRAYVRWYLTDKNLGYSVRCVADN
jgi:uncharacterized protein (TIGR02145 family)